MSPDHEKTVFIVDDDVSVRDALSLFLGLRGYRTANFASAEDFLSACQPNWAGCFLLDIRMPGIDGLTLQKRLGEIGCSLPVIVITGHGDVESARQAFRAHAVDFLIKPLDHDRLISAIEESLSMLMPSTGADLKKLTHREHQVMKLVVAGRRNSEISSKLGISVRTVEAHKANIMAKLDVDNVADLVRISMGIRQT